jgi:diguanylate cyclase (GGDEF)-like protein
MAERPHGPQPEDDARQSGLVRRGPWFFETKDNGDLIDAGFRHMRIAAAILLFPFVLAYDASSGTVQLPVSNLFVAICLAFGLLATNALTLTGARLSSERQRYGLSLAVLIADAGLTALFALVMSGTGGDLAWFLLSIPVLEAGMRFGLLGSLITWLTLVVIDLGSNWMFKPNSLFLENLEVVAARMGMVMVVAIPGIHLAQRLMMDIRIEKVITNEAKQRSHLLETVAQSSQRVGRLDAGMVEEVLKSAILLGLDIADICVKSNDGNWRVETSRCTQHGIDLPDPNSQHGPKLEPAAKSAMVTRVGDDSMTDSYLRRSGLSSLVVCALGSDGITSVILRGGRGLGRPMIRTISDCVELLAGNATIALQNKRLVGELRAMQARLHHQAYHDPLTGLANRTRFIDELEKQLSTCRDNGEHAAVAFVDLDRFKPVNDSLGHDVGNELLIAVGRRLQGVVRGTDMVARFGGDEFVILITDIDLNDADRRLNSVGTAVCEAIAKPFTVSGHEAVISCSVGIAMTDGAGADAGDLVRRADLAMYRAKKEGKARWAQYQADLDEEVVNRIRLESDLRRAIHDLELDVAYQAILSLRNGATVAAEALLRWTHPEFGPQSPEHIVSIAEDSGLILELGELVMTAACNQAARWQRTLNNPPAVSINVSPRQLFHPQFLDMFDNVLAKTKANPSGIILEITENFVGHGSDFGEVLNDVKARNVQLALDDFGQGQTALRHLRTLPLDLLKIDKSFVQQGDKNSEDQAILRAIIQMAHDLGMLVVADGIETRSQLELLNKLGCDLVQGYLLHPPSSSPQIETRFGGGPRQPAPEMDIETSPPPVASLAEAHEILRAQLS